VSLRADFLQLVAFALPRDGDGLTILREAQLVPEEKIPNRLDLDRAAIEFIEWRMCVYKQRAQRLIPKWIVELEEQIAQEEARDPSGPVPG